MRRRFFDRVPLVAAFAAALCGGPGVAQPPPEFDPSKIQVLIVTGRHVHDWQGTTPVLRNVLEATGRFEVRVAEEFRGAGPEALADYDLVVVNYYDRGAQPRLRWGERADRALEAFVGGGKGLVLYHLALGAFAGWTEYERMSGANWRPEKGHHSARHDFDVDIVDRAHPIMQGLATPIRIENDELYANLLVWPESAMHVLATAYDDHALYDPERVRQPIPGPGITQPILWTTRYGEGRVFVTTLGHAKENVATQAFAITFARGAEWAATGEVTLPIPPAFAD